MSKTGFERTAADLGDEIRRLRIAADKTLEALAYESGVSVRRLLEIEKGRTDPRLSTVLKIATALSVNLRDMF